jgi:hypothetical protein
MNSLHEILSGSYDRVFPKMTFKKLVEGVLDKFTTNDSNQSTEAAASFINALIGIHKDQLKFLA